jgi:hypothetical protein
MNNWKILGLLLLLALMAYGCVGAGERSSSDEVQAFFGAANQANYLGVMSMSPQNVDLSAYTSFMGVKYPPTDSVEVLSAPPSRPYQAFAVLRGAAAPASPSQTVAPADLARFTAKAKAIGADAIIICQLGEPGQTATGPSAQVEAVAIKYRLENPGEKKGRL